MRDDEIVPSRALLEQALSRQWDGQLPLHAKVHRGLKYAIENYFQDGQRFFTEKELIEYLKVSQVTVRRAVYDLVREGMLERRVAKGTFVRKRIGGKGKKGFEVAIHVADWDSSFLSQLLQQVLGACSSHQLQPKVFYSRQSGDILNRDGEVWNQSEISAAILISTPPNLAIELCRLYNAGNKRIVAVDSRVPGERTDFVGTDNRATTRIGLDHLIGLGHERICLLLNELEDNENVMQRAEFFEMECRARGLKGWKVVHCATTFREDSYTRAHNAMEKVMTEEPRPTAIFAFDDPGAWAALKWCNQNNVRVPHDLSVLGFANDKPSAFTHPALTTISHPIPELAAITLEMLMQPSSAPQSRLLTPALVIRESTAGVGVE
ncbi:MAG: substrate-binding domain-containing protein [Candidatus Methylacidiphilales bacterium]